MKDIIKSILNKLKLYKIFNYIKFRIKLKRYKCFNRKIKLIVGSGATYYKGWLHSDIYFLNILHTKDWESFFEINSLSNILAEHVWEHLTLKQSRISLKNCYNYLKKGGRIRIAVPDGYSPNRDYINRVRPGGFGCGSDDHRVLYNYDLLKTELEKSGFIVQGLEYFTKEGQFIQNKWDIKEGFIKRSYKYDSRNKNGLKYTSLIMDGIKT